MKLKDLLKQYPQNVLMREAIRRQRVRSIQESKTPQSGAYWWIPLPDGKWTLEVYYDNEYGDTPHDYIWQKFVVERLATLWNKDPVRLRRRIGDNYAGLPRGRVNKIRDGWTIVHGDDAPKNTRGIDGVLNAFNLKRIKTANPEAVRIFVDEHESMIPGDPESVENALGANLGLKGSFAMDLDW